MDLVLTVLIIGVTRTSALLMDARHMIGLGAAVAAALLAAQLGWHGTDRVVTRRSSPDED